MHTITVKEIEPLPEGVYEVTVTSASTTTHRVSLLHTDYDRLHRDDEPPEGLIRRSFDFLLEREPNTSILATFDLPLIGTYFPEYEVTMAG